MVIFYLELIPRENRFEPEVDFYTYKNHNLYDCHAIGYGNQNTM